MRLDSQNLTPRARQKVAYAGGNEKSHRVGSKSLSELAEWTLNATRVSELTFDFIHLLSYVYALAMAVGPNADDAWRMHTRWITALWKGQAVDVLAQWRSLAQQWDIPAEALPDNDPRRPIQRGLTYLENNLDRVDYPRYRRLGLPVTSTLMESLVKEFNLRVKGTEEFWNDPQGAEAILTVRAALLSEDDCFAQFFANRPGCRYRRRSTLTRVQNQQASLESAA